jgi:hypothetical protein
MSNRVLYRDYYDFAMILKRQSIDLNEVLNLVRQKEVRNTISLEKIFSNCGLALQDKQQYIASIYYSEELSNKDIKSELNKRKFGPIIMALFLFLRI